MVVVRGEPKRSLGFLGPHVRGGAGGRAELRPAVERLLLACREEAEQEQERRAVEVGPERRVVVPADEQREPRDECAEDGHHGSVSSLVSPPNRGSAAPSSASVACGRMTGPIVRG